MEDIDRGRQLFLMYADFRLAGNVAYTNMNAAGALERNLLGGALIDFFQNGWVYHSKLDEMECEMRNIVYGSLKSVWIHLLRNMKANHQVLGIGFFPYRQRMLDQKWWRAEYRDSGTLPPIQAYFAIRINRHFEVNLHSQLSLAACTIYDQAPMDAELFVEDAEERRENIEKLVRTVKRVGFRATLIAEFAVPLSINSYFINVVNRS